MADNNILKLNDQYDFITLMQTIDEKYQNKADTLLIGLTTSAQIEFSIPFSSNFKDHNCNNKVLLMPASIARVMNLEYDNQLNFINSMLWEFLLATPAFISHLDKLSKAINYIYSDINSTNDILDHQEEVPLLIEYYKKKYDINFSQLRKRFLHTYGVDLYDCKDILMDKTEIYNISNGKNDEYTASIRIQRKFENFYSVKNVNSISLKNIIHFENFGTKDFQRSLYQYRINTIYPLHHLLKKSVSVEINPFVAYDTLTNEIKKIYDDLEHEDNDILKMLSDIYNVESLHESHCDKIDIYTIDKDKKYNEKIKSNEKAINKTQQEKKIKSALLIYTVMNYLKISNKSLAIRYLNFWILKLIYKKLEICYNDNNEKYTFADTTDMKELTIDTSIFISKESKNKRNITQSLDAIKKLLNIK